MCDKRHYDSKRILTWDWRKCLIVIYAFSLHEAFRHKSRFKSFYIPFRVIFGFVDPFTAYCLGSFRNCFSVPNTIGFHWFHFIFHGFKPLGWVSASHGFFKWGGITLHLKFLTFINFIIIRNDWSPDSLRPSRGLVRWRLYETVVALSHVWQWVLGDPEG